jgi:hypothetical protein
MLQIILQGTLVLTIALSLAFSLSFWGQLGDGSYRWMFVLVAVVLESSKCLAWCLSLKAYAKGYFGILLFAGGLFLLLVTLSIVGSSLQLHQSYVTQKARYQERDSRAQALSERIAQQQRYIRYLIDNVRDDTTRGFRTRAQLLLREDLPQANAMLEALLESKQEEWTVYRLEPKSLLFAFLEQVSKHMELSLCVVIGTLLDIVLAFLFWLYGIKRLVFSY